MMHGEYVADRYSIYREIGKGGGGVVYLADDHNLKKNVVIKQILNVNISSETLRTEVDILKRLHHPALPQVYDFLEKDGRVFTVMEYIPGKNLEEYLKAGVSFSQEQILIWAKQLVEVVSYMHDQEYPVVHRDIKPSNIMIKPDGNLCLIDFNISDDDLSNCLLNGYSRGYASPEQMEQGRRIECRQNFADIVIDQRTDIYSIGAVLYRLLSGRIKGNSGQNLREMNCCWEPLAAITDKCMEKNAGRRYQKADDLLYALNNLEKYDQNYKKWVTLSRLNSIAGVLCIVLGLVVFLYGKSIDIRESYLKDYQDYTEAVEEHSEDSEELGIDLLNSRKYKSILEHNPEEKADIFYYLGIYYLEKDNPEKAEAYLSEAVKIEKKTIKYYRVYAQALLRSGKTGDAKNMISKAEYYGMSEAEKKLLEGEIAYQEGKYEMASGMFYETIEQSTDREIKEQAVSRYADTLLQLKNYEKTIQILNERYRGEMIRDYSLKDVLNLALAYHYAGRSTDSKNILLEAVKYYPEEYRLYMRLSYLSYEKETKKASGVRNYEEAWRYYREAEARYEDQEEKVQDEEWDRLKEIMEQLRKYGWL